MNIGIMTVRGADYHPNFRLAQAADDRGGALFRINPYEWTPGIIKRNMEIASGEGLPLPDAVIPRQGAQIGGSSLTVLTHFHLMGVPLINSPDAVRTARDQYLTLQVLSRAGVRVPDTVFVNRADHLEFAAASLGGFPLVIKPVSGRQGKGVMRADSMQEAAGHLDSSLDTAKGILVQQYIPPEGRKDTRVLVIGGRAEAAMFLVPLRDDFRANYHLTGRSGDAEISDEIGSMAVEAAAAVGLDIAGVDILTSRDGVSMVLEVNYSPGFKGLEKATGLDIAGMIMDYTMSVAGKRRKRK